MAYLTPLSLGPLTTLWTPPASCLSTTTKWGEYRGYFLGFHESIGIDAECFPSLVPTLTASPTISPLVLITAAATATPAPAQSGETQAPSPAPAPIATITGWTTITPAPKNPPKTALWPSNGYVSQIAYYSPAICPSGYTYAATYTDLTRYRPYGAATTGRGSSSSNSIQTNYICCPDGYTVYPWTSTKYVTRNGWITTSSGISYFYSGCSRTTSRLSNVWTLTPGWPTAKPDPVTGFEGKLAEVTGSRTYVSFTAYALGLVVGWGEADGAVVGFLERGNVSLPPLPILPQNSSRSLATATKAGIIAGVVIAVCFAFVIGCCFVCRRRKRQRRAGGGSAYGGVEETIPLDDTATAQAANGRSKSEYTAASTMPAPVSIDEVDQGPPPRYEEATAGTGKR